MMAFRLNNILLETFQFGLSTERHDKAKTT
jgi:hypothetical protein